MIHRLKTIQPYFDAVVSGRKTFELRINDRDFSVGDRLILCEWDGKRFTGREHEVEVTYMMRGEFGLPTDLCVLAIREVYPEPAAMGGDVAKTTTCEKCQGFGDLPVGAEEQARGVVYKPCLSCDGTGTQLGEVTT